MATVVFPETGNGGITRLNGGINDSVTTVNVDSATALTLDDSTTDAYIVVIDASTYRSNPIITPETAEIMQVTAVSTNALTVTRGVDGSSAKAFSDNDIVELRVVSATIQRIYDALTDGNDELNINTLTTAGIVSVDDTTDTSSAVTGSIHTDGGVGIAKKLWVGTDATINGDLLMGASGTNKTFNQWLSAGELQADTCAAVANRTLRAGDTIISSLNFDQTTAENCTGAFCLPSDYDGSSLDFDIYWTSASGTGGVYFQINLGLYTDGEDMSGVNAGGTNSMTSAGADYLNILTISATPSYTTAGDTFLTFHCRRQTGQAADTLGADCELLGVNVSYT